MRVRFSHAMTLRLVAALLLVVVGLQAAQPWQMSRGPQHGSAFSASTSEVALAAVRRAEPARHQVAPEPLVPVADIARAPEPAGAATVRGPRVRPDSTGPPAPPPLLLKPGPRAPPA